MFDAITFPDRLTVAVPADLAEAVRTVAAARGLTGADYVRGAVQARLMLDGAKFDRLPDLKRVTTRRGSTRAI